MFRFLAGLAVAVLASSPALAIVAPADTTPPIVSLLSPNGGETFTAGTSVNITWISADNVGVVSIEIEFSFDGGATYPLTVAAGLPGSAVSYASTLPTTFITSQGRIRIRAFDAAGNQGSASSAANFSVVAAADTQPPTVSISAPAAGSTLQANTLATIQFSAADNVGLASFNVQFAADGVNFNTTLASGLPGTASSFQFLVPAISATNAALRVQALDPSGNIGSATVGSLTIQNDAIAPTVTVTSPQAKDKFRGGDPILVAFTSSDNIAVVSHELQVSLDGGGSFSTLATGVPGNVQSYQVTAPDAKEKDAVIRVIARDAAGNAGQGNSAPFKLKADNKN